MVYFLASKHAFELHFIVLFCSRIGGYSEIGYASFGVVTKD